MRVGCLVTDTHPLIWYTAGKHANLCRASWLFNAAFANTLIVIPSPVFWEISILVYGRSLRSHSITGHPLLWLARY